jgi:hypothetical protein
MIRLIEVAEPYQLSASRPVCPHYMSFANTRYILKEARSGSTPPQPLQVIVSGEM